jgi:hypothetical protein
LRGSSVPWIMASDVSVGTYRLPAAVYDSLHRASQERGMSINSLLIEGAELRLALLELEHLSLPERAEGIANILMNMSPAPARASSAPEMHFHAMEGGMCPWPDRPSPASHPSWCTLSNRLRIRNTRDDIWQWEVVSKSGKQFAKGPAHHSFGLASKTDWVPSLSECRECPDHPGVRLKLNLNRVPICAVPGCDYGP